MPARPAAARRAFCLIPPGEHGLMRGLPTDAQRRSVAIYGMLEGLDFDETCN
jgi:hypothetical protein